MGDRPMFVYSPVVRAQAGLYSGAALVGTNSVSLGWSFDDTNLRSGLRGFAVRRSEFNPDGEMIEMRLLGDFKRFKENDDGRADNVTSLTAPFQRFRWNEYTLSPGRGYRYEVFAMRGTPTALTREEDPLVFEFSPTLEDDGRLGVYVNRGVTAAKAYFRRFGDVHPKDVEPKGTAYAWLSRGLKESLLGFIRDAQAGDALHVAIYEFFDHEVVGAFKEARQRGVDILVVHDAKRGKNSTTENLAVVSEFGLEEVAIQRTTVNISHNKLVVRLIRGVPKLVWTASANFSENAFNFQTNTALVVRDPAACQHYEDYFQNLTGNPTKKASKLVNRAIMTEADSLNPRWAQRTFFHRYLSSTSWRPLPILSVRRRVLF